MVKVRPFRLMLWSLLVITAGGALIVYGTRVSDRNRVSYSEMIEGMADMSKSRATQDNPPVLEIWDMGWLIMTIGVTVAVPGVVLMLGSMGTMLFHKLVPEREDASLSRAGEDDQADHTDDDADQEHDQYEGDEVGEELLHKRHEITSGIAPRKPVPPIAPLAVPLDIQPLDLVDADATADPAAQRQTDSPVEPPAAPGGKTQMDTDAPSTTESAQNVGDRQGPVPGGGEIYEVHDVQDEADGGDQKHRP